MELRNPDNDKGKSLKIIKEQQDVKCMLEDCTETLSTFEGPGSNILCRKHQRECSEYGGMGKPSRPHTFYRGWVCTTCNYDPREDELRFGHVTDPFIRNRAMRGVMHGDHIQLKSKGGSNTADNIDTSCCLCHMAKTYIEGDFLGAKQ